MTQEEKYYADIEHQKEVNWQRFEEESKQEAKIIPFSIAYPDLNAIIIENGNNS